MKLYERVRLLAKQRGMTVKALAEKIGVKYTTFNTYFNDKGEHNLFKYLENVLEHCPGANKIWLYCEEGEIQGDARKTAVSPMRADDPSALRIENGILKDKLIAALEDNKLLRDELARIDRMSGDMEPIMRPAEGGPAVLGVPEELK